MLLHDDIMIIGDSFVKHRHTDKHWPYLLKQLLMQDDNFDPRPPRGWGLSGVSWWSTRARLLGELQVHPPKLLVIVHTESTRLPNDLEFPLNAGTAGHDYQEILHSLKENGFADRFTPELLKAADNYFKYLCSIPFHEWATIRWYDELDDLITQHKIPQVIHLHAFGSLLNDRKHVFKTGMTSNQVLWNISDDFHAWGQNKNFDINNPNHFSKENNVKIANALFRSFNTYNPGLRNLNLLG